MAKQKEKKEKHQIRSIRISDRVLEKMQRKKKRGKSWDRFFDEEINS